MLRDIKHFIAKCHTCQLNHYEAIAPPGLLQPNSIPDKAWTNISMDFIDGLPVSEGKTVIWVVVDRLNKFAHFVPMSHPYMAASVAQLFVKEIFRLQGEKPHSWVQAIPWAEWWYNSAFHSTIQMSPFQALYGYPPPTVAQSRMKTTYDKRHTKRKFAVGDHVYLKLQVYKQHSVHQQDRHKLSPRYYGPFEVTERIGQVAYRHSLPNGMKRFQRWIRTK
ncbi:uncharacterized protein LOC133731881 [Rosa rugosa]|uniref:uncharacterized protein LOC133731881 n=1 Tax=Rosa rugosa TaxID=74645 RepID=UPI002B4041B5|nr:uncharacterized protein LOC133731881 [Rosa rugosa]